VAGEQQWPGLTQAEKYRKPVAARSAPGRPACESSGYGQVIPLTACKFAQEDAEPQSSNVLIMSSATVFKSETELKPPRPPFPRAALANASKQLSNRDAVGERAAAADQQTQCGLYVDRFSEEIVNFCRRTRASERRQLLH
jgi:hypothetical protein